MATTGTKLTVPFLVGAGQIVGQGNSPEAWVLYTVDDASTASPVWLDATSKTRSFNVSRGRENELSEIDAGTAQLVLDNRARTFDPVINTSIRPLNRWWIRAQFTGETQDVFKGYAESYDQSWRPPSDAVTTVQCVDEFKVLTLDSLPLTSPPRDSYAEVVMSDQPAGYWQMDEDPDTLVQPAAEPGTVAAEAAAAQGGVAEGFSLEETWWKPGYPR